ncbi:MAG: DUF4339 domain-containing protein [Methylacidiphilales bacterium]|nr:DUF4339 domain-containing protein [Candidatus Methylacidiphilales bacterium]
MSDWYYAVDNEQKGPINESELKTNFATNKLPGDTLVWKEGMENWAPANQVSAFSFRAPPAPAKVQSPDSGATLAATEAPPAGNPDSTKPVDLKSLFSAKGMPLEVDAEDAEKNKLFGIIAYVSILWLVPYLAAKDSPFAKYHANQGFVLFIVEVALWLVLTIIYQIIGMLGLSAFASIAFVLSFAWLAILGLVIYGVLNAAFGKCVPLPVIGGVRVL